jgi:flagellar basal-body rod protein FlgB
VIARISDSTTDALRVALDGLDRRQQAIASNIANLETPDYLATEINFEASLREAVRNGTPAAANVSVERSLAPTRLNGNNVSIDREIVNSTETQLRQRLVVEALNGKYRMLRTAIAGR